MRKIRKDALFSESFDITKIKQKLIPDLVNATIRRIDEVLDENEAELSASLARLFKTMKAAERIKGLME